MMALMYAVQGSFWPLAGGPSGGPGIGGRGRGWIFATLAIGSLAVPLGAGQLVDRLMATQRFLALTYAVGRRAGGPGLGAGRPRRADFVLFLVVLVADRSGVQSVQLAGDAQPGRSGRANSAGCGYGGRRAG